MPDDYRTALRAHVAAKGTPMLAKPSYYNGWEDDDAALHAGGSFWSKDDVPCSWVVPEGTFLTETTDVEWGGTFGEDTTRYVVDVTGCRCACGRYTDVTLRLVSTFGDTLRAALGQDTKGIPL